MIFKDGNTITLRSNGKLMLTGEYLVLRGAKSLTLPLNKGQTMKVTLGKGVPSLLWRTSINDCFWFEATFSIPDFAIANTNDFPTAQNVREMLSAVRKLNPAFVAGKNHYVVDNDLEFNINWGLGSSSSLIHNLARWAEVDPFKLHFLLSEGSGYDIAAAGMEFPFVYRLQDQKPEVRKVMYDPEYKDKLFFVYAGNKIGSPSEVEHFNRGAASARPLSMKYLKLRRSSQGLQISVILCTFSESMKK